MQFKNPYILYALFLLLIPIIVHLFQLRRFKKTPFTNLVFLQSVVKNTRKSATIKKWLILATRLLAITALVFAFAQPFIPNTKRATQEREQLIFLDNSFSMQAKGDKGALLTEAVQDLIATGKNNINLLTFNQVYKDLNISQEQNKLINLDYTAQNLDPEALNLALNRSFSKLDGVAKELVILSDFQSLDTQVLDSLKDIDQYWVNLKPVQNKNTYLDSLKITRQENDYLLEIKVKATSPSSQKVPVSLYNGEQLVSKATAGFNNSQQTSVNFRIPNNEVFQGKLSINDTGLEYDNVFYFYLDKPQTLKVLSINNAEDAFLQKIYKTASYEYSAVTPDQLDYNAFNTNDVVILNEVKNLDASLINRLVGFKNDGGKLIVIPSMQAEAANYQPLLHAFGFAGYGNKNNGTYKLTTINYDHPIYRNVFEAKAANFQYPSISSVYELSSPSAILQLQDGKTFLAQGDGIFVFSAALNSANTNFKDSPLIVPTFEELAKTALNLPKLYYYLGENNSFDLKNQATGDAVYKLSYKNKTFIPLQEQKGALVSISTEEGLDEAGIYELELKDSVVGKIAFNYNRKESLLAESTLASSENVTVHDSVKNALVDLQKASSLNELFKWFVILAVFFLFCEMLILKFLK